MTRTSKLAVLVLVALLGALAATSAVHAEHEEGERHITRGPIDQQLTFNLSGNSCPWVSFYDGTFAHVDGLPLKHCPWNATEADINEIRRYEAGGRVSAIYGGRSFFAASPLPGIPEGVGTLAELRVHRIAQCLSSPEFVYTGPLWLNGSIWCQHLAGVPLTASFHTN